MQISAYLKVGFAKSTRRAGLAALGVALAIAVFSACGTPPLQTMGGVGGTLVSGDWEVTLSSYDRSGENVTVTVELTNVGSQAHSPPGLLIGDNYLIIDDSGRQYQPEGGNSLALTAQLITPVNPGFGLPAIPFVFRVPTNASGLLFQFSGGLLSSEVVFQLERTAQDDIVQHMNETSDNVQSVSETPGPFVSGDWEIGVSNYSRSGQIVSMAIDLKNVGDQPQSPPNIFRGNYLVVDDSGREFSPAYGFSFVRQTTENELPRPIVTDIDSAQRFLAEINPEDSRSAIPLVFSVPANASVLQLQFRGGASAPEVLLQLEQLARTDDNNNDIIPPTDVLLCNNLATFSDDWEVIASNYQSSGNATSVTIQITNIGEQAKSPLELFSNLNLSPNRSFGLIMQFSNEMEPGVSSPPIQFVLSDPSRICVMDRTGMVIIHNPMPTNEQFAVYDTTNGQIFETQPWRGVGWNIRTESSEAEIALAEHLASFGDEVALVCTWSDHNCHIPKELFGAEAWESINYVECQYAGGQRTPICEGLVNTYNNFCWLARGGISITRWVINGSTLDVDLNLEDIAKRTGYTGSTNFRYIIRGFLGQEIWSNPLTLRSSENPCPPPVY